MPFCTNCGKELKEDDNFCFSCGFKVNNEFNVCNEAYAESDEDNDIIILDDESGNPVQFELLDFFEFRNMEFLVLLPAYEDSDEVVILQVVYDARGNEKYETIDDWSLLNAVFEEFARKNSDRFNFQ